MLKTINYIKNKNLVKFSLVTAFSCLYFLNANTLVQACETTSQYEQPNLYTEQRPWGSFTILDEGENYKVKRIVVNPDKRLSLQKHFHRSEHWVIVQGEAVVTVGDQIKTAKANEQIFIEKEQLHRIQNNSDTPLIFIETQCGDYLGEDDIVRYADDFGRG